MTPPVKDKQTPLTAPYRKDFSLTSGAKFLGIGKGTLRSAIERGEVKATKNAAGHYTIEGAQIFQYEANLKADQVQDVPTRTGTGGNTRADTAASTPTDEGAGTGADTPSSTVRDTPADRRAGTVSADMHQTIVEMMESRLRDKDGAIRRLEDDVESWKEQSKSWQNQASSDQRLLTYERDKFAKDKAEIEAGQGGNLWRNVAVFFVVAVLAGTALYFQDDIARTLANFAAVNGSSAAAIESDIPQG